MCSCEATVSYVASKQIIINFKSHRYEIGVMSSPLVWTTGTANLAHPEGKRLAAPLHHILLRCKFLLKGVVILVRVWSFSIEEELHTALMKEKGAEFQSTSCIQRFALASRTEETQRWLSFCPMGSYLAGLEMCTCFHFFFCWWTKWWEEQIPLLQFASTPSDSSLISVLSLLSQRYKWSSEDLFE